MSLRIEPLHPDFVATVSGVDLSKPLDKATVREIEEAIYKYAVLVFHDQPLTQDQLVDYAANFGPLNTGLQKLLGNKVQDRLKNDAITDVSNVDASGQKAAKRHAMSQSTVGNRFWHSDASYEHHPFHYSFLAAVTAVKYRGHTQFADARAAYDNLDEKTKELIKDKIITSWSHNTRHWLGIEDTEQSLRTYPPVRWPMVRVHPKSGRKVLWCDSKVFEVSGMELWEGRALAHEMIEHTGQREHVYSHAWKPNDLIMYDNRSVYHRGQRFDDSERREMRRCATVDMESSSLGEVALVDKMLGEKLRSGLD